MVQNMIHSQIGQPISNLPPLDLNKHNIDGNNYINNSDETTYNQNSKQPMPENYIYSNTDNVINGQHDCNSIVNNVMSQNPYFTQSDYQNDLSNTYENHPNYITETNPFLQNENNSYARNFPNEYSLDNALPRSKCDSVDLMNPRSTPNTILVNETRQNSYLPQIPNLKPIMYDNATYYNYIQSNDMSGAKPAPFVQSPSLLNSWNAENNQTKVNKIN